MAKGQSLQDPFLNALGANPAVQQESDGAE